MKNLINKVRHHGKKVTIYLKSQPKWVVRCMFGIGAILGLVLSLHTHPIGGTNAQSIENPIQMCQCNQGGGTLCDTNKKDSNVQYHTGNIAYADTEGNMFTGIGTITIQSGDDVITILDRNLGAITNDIESTGSYGYTIPFSGNIEEITDGSSLNSTIFGIEEIINSQEDIQLCPDGFHIPSYQEWENITNMLGNDGEYLSENLLLPNIGLWSSSQSDWCGLEPCGDNEQAISAFIPVSVDCPGYSDFGRTSRGNTNGEYGIRCFYDKNQEYHPFIINLYSGQDVIDTLEIWAGNDVILPILDDLGNSIFNGWFTDFELTIPFDDSTPITENLDLYAKWSDTTPPTCNVEYSTTGPTNQDVTATLACDDEDINVTNNGGRVEYTFTGNGTHTFEFQDLAGNTGIAVAEVTGIDKVKPTCDIIYSTTGATTGNVVATLTGCIETITGTEIQHTFTGNGTYIFNFQDLAGNTGSTEAAVTWIGEYTGVYEIKSGQQMINLYNQGKAITCNVIYSGDNGHQTNTMYIKSGVINENLMVITGNTRTMLYSLEKDGYIYSWGDMYLDGIGFYIPYELDVYEELKGIDNNIKSGAIITCTTGVKEDSVFDLPDGVDFFNIDTYYIDSGVYFIIDAKETAKTGENIDFTITVMKDGKRFKNFLGYVLIDVIDEDGDLLDKNTYEAPGYGYYYFASSDKGKKTFSNGLKINKTGDYYIRVNSLQEGEGFFPISIKGKNDPTLTGNYFKITVNSKANPGEYTTFTVRAIKDGVSYSNYTGTVIFTLSNKDGGLINKRNYTFSNSGRYTFEASDLGRKTFYSGLKINETGTYILEVNGLNDNFKGSTTINVGKSHGSAEFKYDTLKFNPKYSDEMNEAYQYARYYDITTKNSIKDADMYSGLNRIAMAKMLTNYAENVLGKDNFNTGRNCSFSDVSNSLDKDYDYGVTKACQLGIMGVNMPNNKFYPNGGVTRAEFATALSRLLYGTKDGTEKYYSTHITKLRREGIITNTDPALWELRGYVMLMLKRVAEK